MINKAVISIVIAVLTSGYFGGQRDQAKGAEKVFVYDLDSVLVNRVADDSLRYVRNGDLCEGKSKLQKFLFFDSLKRGFTFARAEGLVGNVESARTYRKLDSQYDSLVSEYYCEQDLFATDDWVTNSGFIGLRRERQIAFDENGIARVVELRDEKFDTPVGLGVRIMKFKSDGFDVIIRGCSEGKYAVFTPKMMLWSQEEFDNHSIGGYMDWSQYSYSFDQQGRFVKYQWDVEDGGDERVYEYSNNEIVPVKCKYHSYLFDGSNMDIEYSYSGYKLDDKGNWIERDVKETKTEMVVEYGQEEREVTEIITNDQYKEYRNIKYLD